MGQWLNGVWGVGEGGRGLSSGGRTICHLSPSASGLQIGNRVVGLGDMEE